MFGESQNKKEKLNIIIVGSGRVGATLVEQLGKEGNDITITFNVKYMQDVMRIIESERIELNMNTHVTPCVITPVDNRDYLHLVLPVRERA